MQHWESVYTRWWILVTDAGRIWLLRLLWVYRMKACLGLLLKSHGVNADRFHWRGANVTLERNWVWHLIYFAIFLIFIDYSYFIIFISDRVVPHLLNELVPFWQFLRLTNKSLNRRHFFCSFCYSSIWLYRILQTFENGDGMDVIFLNP